MPTPLRLTKPQSQTSLYTCEYLRANKPYLSSGEALTSAAVVVRSLSQVMSLAISSVSITGSMAFFYLSGGDAGAVYTVDVLAQTNFGRTPVRTFELHVNDAYME
jgi:hypothetical protein